MGSAVKVNLFLAAASNLRPTIAITIRPTTAPAIAAIPEFAYSLSHIVKAIYGKNKKAFVLDLDNTLWGGVVGDDGPENLEIGSETAMGEAYLAFQEYLKAVIL